MYCLHLYPFTFCHIHACIFSKIIILLIFNFMLIFASKFCGVNAQSYEISLDNTGVDIEYLLRVWHLKCFLAISFDGMQLNFHNMASLKVWVHRWYHKCMSQALKTHWRTLLFGCSDCETSTKLYQLRTVLFCSVILLFHKQLTWSYISSILWRTMAPRASTVWQGLRIFETFSSARENGTVSVGTFYIFLISTLNFVST